MSLHHVFRTALVLGLAFSAGLPSGGARAQERDPAVPTLADLMSLTQLRHFKLWYAHSVDNWDLANYELTQFRTTVERIVKLYPRASSISQSELIREKTGPALDDLAKAISDKSAARFDAAFAKLTNACNECHQVAGVSFISVRIPTRSPFSNQDFAPGRSGSR